MRSLRFPAGSTPLRYRFNYEDCCTVFTPKHPKTRPQLDAVEKAQALIPLEELMERALAGVKIVPIDA